MPFYKILNPRPNQPFVSVVISSESNVKFDCKWQETHKTLIKVASFLFFQPSENKGLNGLNFPTGKFWLISGLFFLCVMATFMYFSFTVSFHRPSPQDSSWQEHKPQMLKVFTNNQRFKARAYIRGKGYIPYTRGRRKGEIRQETRWKVK